MYSAMAGGYGDSRLVYSAMAGGNGDCMEGIDALSLSIEL